MMGHIFIDSPVQELTRQILMEVDAFFPQPWQLSWPGGKLSFMQRNLPMSLQELL